jgi:hypothetical protein
MSIFSKAAKTTFYGPNGTGRDTYIFANNGGLALSSEANTQPPLGKNTDWVNILTGTFKITPEKHIYMKSPVIHSRSIHYHGDGTGRDTYIQYD